MVLAKSPPPKQTPPKQATAGPEPAYRRPLAGRAAGGSRAIDSALAGRSRADAERGYPRHARSLTARTVRQRVLVLGAALVVAAIASVLAAPKAIPHHQELPDPALAAAAVARDEAAAWVRDWVGVSDTVGCDPQMCAVLQQQGVNSGQISPIYSSTPDPEDGAVVVATPIIRSQFGWRLAAVYAPAVLARFGTGTNQVDIMVVATEGSVATYQRQLSADW